MYNNTMLSLSFWEDNMKRLMSGNFRQKGKFSGLERMKPAPLEVWFWIILDAFSKYTAHPRIRINVILNPLYIMTATHHGVWWEYVMFTCSAPLWEYHPWWRDTVQAVLCLVCVSAWRLWLGWRCNWRILRAGFSHKKVTPLGSFWALWPIISWPEPLLPNLSHPCHPLIK